MSAWLRLACLCCACATLCGCWHYQRFVDSQQMADFVTDETGRPVFADTPGNWATMSRMIENRIAREFRGRRPNWGHDCWKDSWTVWMEVWRERNRMAGKLVAYSVERRRQEGLPELDGACPPADERRDAFRPPVESWWRFRDAKAQALADAMRERRKVRDIDRLLAAGADPNARSEGNMTLLYAPGAGWYVERLLEHGGDPNALQGDGSTLMHSAVGGSRLGPTLHAALRHGGDVNVRDAWGDTPLSSTDRLLGMWPEVLAALLDAPGVDIEAPNRHGTTVAMKVAGLRDDILLELLVRGADYEARNASGYGVLDRLAFQGQFKFPDTRRQRRFDRVVAWLAERGVELPAPKHVLAPE